MSNKITVIFAVKAEKLEELAISLAQKFESGRDVFDSFIDPRNLCAETQDRKVVGFLSTYVGISIFDVMYKVRKAISILEPTDFLLMVEQGTTTMLEGNLDYPSFNKMTMLDIASKEEIREKDYIGNSVTFTGKDGQTKMDVRLDSQQAIVFTVNGETVELRRSHVGQLMLHLHNLMNYTDRGGDQ